MLSSTKYQQQRFKIFPDYSMFKLLLAVTNVYSVNLNAIVHQCTLQRKRSTTLNVGVDFLGALAANEPRNKVQWVL